MTNSAMTNNHSVSSSKRNNGKIRAAHSQFSEENARIINTGYQSQRSEGAKVIVGAPQNNAGRALAPIADHNDPQRQSYAYSQERRPKLFDSNGLELGNTGQSNGALEQSH